MTKLIATTLILVAFFQISVPLDRSKSCISCEKFLGDLKNPVALTSLNKNSFLIIEQMGTVLLYNPNDKSVHQLLNMTDKVVHDFSKRDDHNPEQRGLLGLAVNPKCLPNCNSFYLYYSAPKLDISEDHRSIASRFTISSLGKVTEDKIILNISQPSDVYNGGQLFFDKEDNLYITVGDSGMRNESFLNTSKLGKILRTNVVNKNNGMEIFASGFENPWRCGIASEGIICGDVGAQNEDRITISRWHRELNSKNKDPIHIHGEKVPSAVIGGIFYTENDFPRLKNSFLYGDYVNGSLHTLYENEPKKWKSEKLNLCCNCELKTTKHVILSFGEDYLQNVYVLTRAKAKDNKLKGIIYKLVDPDNENVSCDGSLINSGLYLVATIQFLFSIKFVCQ